MAILEDKFVLTTNKTKKAMPHSEIVHRIKDKDGLICLLTDQIDEKVINAGNRLKIIANYAVGYNNIDLELATKKKIAVTNTPGVLTETTADLTFGLILCVARRIVEADRFIREHRFQGWEPSLFLGSDVYKKVLGIIGPGRIGRAVARRARGFDMKVIYYGPHRLSLEIEKELGVEYCPLDLLLKKSDFVSIHTPLNASTYHLIGERELSLMKPGGYLINVARGAVIEEKALIRALKKKLIAGCALDVYEYEPQVSEELTAMSNTVLVPHIGSASKETREKMAMMVVDNVISVLMKNRPPPNIVNPEIYD